MRARRHRRRAVLLLLVGAVAAALGIVAHATQLTRRPELASVDARFSIRGGRAPRRDVVVVGIDARTLATRGIPRPPLPRRLDATVIDRLRAAGAKVIAVDLAFDQPTDPADDAALVAAIRRAGRVVVATTLPRPVLDVVALRATAGSSNFRARHGVIRRLPSGDRGLASFAVAAARRAGVRIDRGAFTGDGAWIDFAGGPGTYPAVAFSDVLRGRFRASAFRGKVVVVGATDPVLQDNHPTSAGGGNMSGPEIQANAIATLLAGVPLRGAAGWLGVALIALCGFAAPLAALRLTGLRWLVVPVLLAAAYAVAVQVAFDRGRIAPVAAPALALALGTAGTLAVAYATDLADRRRLRVAFGRFVPPGVLDDVVAQAHDELQLGGTRLEATVLFCDLRSFTTVAERLPAERVIELLNRYLEAMSDAVLDHGGTVVAYMGDGMMAVFGAPLPQDDHADRALAAAHEMLGARLDRFNAWVREVGVAEPFRLGVGICTGPVMSGTVGSSRRLEYAAVGDTTNTAARLQAMTKEAGVPILVAGTTRAALRRDPGDGLRRVGDAPVRGRSTDVELWTFAHADGAGDVAGPAAAPGSGPPAATRGG